MHSQAGWILVGAQLWAPLHEPCLLTSAVEMVLPYGTQGLKRDSVQKEPVTVTTVAS